MLVKPVGEDTIVYDVQRFRAHCLEPLAARIWALCDAAHSVEDIAARVSSEQEHAILPEVVQLALRRLERADLLETRQPRPAFLPCSRRDLMKRVAAGGGLAVVSTVLPTPAQAASLLQNGSPCSIHSQCASDCCCNATRLCAGPGDCSGSFC